MVYPPPHPVCAGDVPALAQGAASGAPGGRGDGVQTISPDVEGVTSLAFGPDGGLLAAVGRDTGRIVVWDVGL
jgi:WD40 repeat protein